VDLVAIGHLTLDQTSGRARPGGAVYYAAITAWRLGLQVAIVTSYGPDFPADAIPPEIQIVNVPSDRTTIFELDQSPGGRRLRLLGRAADIEETHLPEEWREAPLALLCPVIGEVDPALSASFVEAALGVAPQGWMRQRARGGAITAAPWADARLVLPHTQLLVVSEEDVATVPKATLDEWFQDVPMGAVTHGAGGATLFVNGEPYHVEPDRAAEVDATGAGDVFATTLLIEYDREGNPWEAAAAAACAAAASVETAGSSGIPDRPTLAARLAAYRRRLGA
jgi:sugar/nucleoside kinase (ribokinase family)